MLSWVTYEGSTHTTKVNEIYFKIEAIAMSKSYSQLVVRQRDG
jgi:hypothetical protein